MQINFSYREIWKIASPVILGSIAVTILNITDTAFLGRVGEAELGASAVGGVLYFVFVMIGISIGTGAQIMIARRTGENKDDEVGAIFDHTLLILATLSLLLFFVLKWGSLPVLKIILKSEELINKTSEFLHYRSYGLLFVMMAAAFRSFYVGIARPAVFGMYSFLLAGVNIVLCYLLIFGKMGFDRMGIAGAGLASSIAEFLGLFFLMIVTLVRGNNRKYNLFRFTGFSKSLSLRIMDLSAPLVVQNLLSMGSWFIFFVFIEKLGKHELATSNIVRGAYMINMTPFWGFSVAANSMISNIIGQQRQQDVIILLNRIIRITLLMSLAMILVNLLIPVPLLRLFSGDEQLIMDSLSSLRIVSLAMLFFAFAIVTISAVSGTGATRVALKIEIAAILIYLVYNYIFTFVFPSGVEILWLSEVIYWIFTGIVSYNYIKSMRWKKIVV